MEVAAGAVSALLASVSEVGACLFLPLLPCGKRTLLLSPAGGGRFCIQSWALDQLIHRRDEDQKGQSSLGTYDGSVDLAWVGNSEDGLGLRSPRV